MKNNYLKRLQNLILRKTQFVSSIPSEKKIVYLTFDDGPEERITEFVLDELDKYEFKATFFCRGDNAEKHPELFRKLCERGHSIGNHTYNHFHSFETNSAIYALDVEKANAILQTELFRPPHGCLTFSAWLRIHKDKRLFFWSLNSGDSDMNNFIFMDNINMLMTNTRPGDIVLFHFCHLHEKRTKELLPVYLKWLSENGYKSAKL